MVAPIAFKRMLCAPLRGPFSHSLGVGFLRAMQAHPGHLNIASKQKYRDNPKSPLGNTSPTFTASPKRGSTHRCEDHEDPSNGYGLGRDDPLWPRYVKEAEKWDDIKMNKWNK